MTEASGLWAATVLVRAQCPCSLSAPADRHLRQQRRQIFQPFTDAQLDRFVARQTLPRCGVVARASDADGVSNAGDNTGDAKSGGELSETVLERLQKAEKEAADLRYQLSLARDMQIARGEREKPKMRKLGRGSRIDGGNLKRENLLDGLGRREGNWVQERDLEFFKGATRGPVERDYGKSATAEERAVVQRRLILGVGLTAVAAALALVPLDALSPPPAKPLFFFLTPLVRIQALLDQAASCVQDAQWDDLRFILKRIQGPPNDLKANLQSATAALSDQRARDAARVLAGYVVEYIYSADPDKYFDAMARGASRGGAQAAAFVDFSSSSIIAAKAKLAAFLQLFPAEDVQAAREQASPKF